MFPDFVDHFLTRRFPNMFRPGMQQMYPLFQQGPAFAQISRRFGLEDKLNFLSDVFNFINP